MNDNNSEAFIKNLLEYNIRIDGREGFQGRMITIEFMDKYGIHGII